MSRSATMRPAKPDPRVARSKSVVLETAIDLLAEEGYAGATVQAISQRSGVAKTTIYRHWPSRAALLADAFVALVPPRPPRHTGNLRADVVNMLVSLAEGLSHARWARVLPSLVDAAERDRELAALARQLTVQRRQPLRAILQGGVARGDLAPDTDLDLATVMLSGPLFYRRLLSHQPISRRFVERLVDRVLMAFSVEHLT